jgi:guanosine-3',5'-bis(diphosphate) 3'-pyrophosphohydrolase
MEVKTLIDAIAFAADKHRNQRRKDADASPYTNHPIALAGVLAVEAGIDDIEVLIAAVLHDTIEDTQATREELTERFGKSIASIVAEATDDKTQSKEARRALQIKSARTLSAKAKLVKLADKICNLRDIANHPPADWSVQRKGEYFAWAEMVVAGLRGTHSVLEELFGAAYAQRVAL